MIENKQIALLQNRLVCDSILNRDGLKNKSERFDRILQLYQHMLNIARKYLILHHYKTRICRSILVKVLLESYTDRLNTLENKDYYKAQILGHFQDLKKQIQSPANESNQ